MPQNYLWLGVIALLFPKARIIHAVRHPLDTCLSCYFQSFTEIDWASDLASIARVYRYYRETMDHWRTVLPPGMLLDVCYEDLVADPETGTRTLLEACGLEWDPVCLAFHRHQRQVQTASVWQVRQPVYKTSRARWVNYGPWIRPLIDPLVDYLQADREVLSSLGIHPDSH